MSESHFCPECGALLPANAPGGLCPRCLLGAAAAETSPYGADAVDDWKTVDVPPAAGVETAPVELDRFKRAVLDLGLIPAAEFERFVARALGGMQGLARALVVAGKLTPYQAGALAQGKERGLVIGNYFILDKLGAGGMGVVFKARHRRLGRVVALKILPPSLARNPDLLSRFRREVEVAAKLSHPNIVSVLDADEDRGVHFMTMEYIKGNNLDHLVRDGGVLPVDLALDCTIQAARGLAAAHAQGIVHRDIKPGNLMLDESGVVRVLDLGLARLVEAANPFGETTPGPLTEPGTYMGTVDFMAPEQGVDSRGVDHRADIYSLGCTLCYLLTGRAPFEGATTVLTRLMAHQGQAPASLRTARPDVPRSLDDAYQTMMAKKPDDRPPSMSAVVALLEACRSATGGDEASRSGLKAFASTVIIQRTAPRGAVPDSPNVRRTEPAGVHPVPVEHPKPRRPVAPTAILEPVLNPRQSAPDRQPEKAPSHASALALGAVALLALGGLGYILFARKADTAANQVNASGPQPPTSDPQGSRAAPTPWEPPTASAAFRVGSVWVNPAKALKLEVLERAAESFRARFAVGNSLREVRGTIEGNRIAWLAADVRPIRGGAGKDNKGIIQGNTIALSWPGDAATLTVERTATETPEALAWQATFDVVTLYSYQGAEWRAIAVSADGRQALVGGGNQFPGVLNVDNGRVERSLGWHYATIADVAISTDGRLGLVGTFKVPKQNTKFGNVKEAGTLWFWDLKTGKTVFPMQQPYEGDVTAVAISADGRRGLSGGSSGELTLWDLTTGQPLRSLGPQAGEVFPHALAFFPDGRSAATGGADRRVQIWDLDTGREQAAWPGLDGTTRGLAISADGRRLVTGSYEGTVLLWDADRGAILHRFAMPANDQAIHVAFDPDGHIVAAGNGLTGPPARPGNLLVWDADTHLLLRRDERPFARHRAVAALSGGSVLTGDDYAVRRWSPRPSAAVASEPTAVASGQKNPVDLLALIGREPHKSYGTWQMSNGELLSPATAYARLQIPYTPPSDYRIDMKVELVGKLSDAPLGLGLLVGGAQTEIVIDKLLAKDGRQSRSLETNGRYSGLNHVDGVPVPFGPNAHHGQLLSASRPVQIVVTVGPTSVRMTCDGARVLDWNGDPRQLIRHVNWNGVGSKSLFLSSSSSVRIQSMTLTPSPATSP